MQKPYRIPEINATIFASSEQEFLLKKEKLLSRAKHFVRGGIQTSKIAEINQFMVGDKKSK